MEGTQRNPSFRGQGERRGEHSRGSGAPPADSKEDVVRHLPYLRRYARALSGAQEVGDQYVRICLEALVEEPNRLQAGPFLRVQLYHLFHQTWKAVAERIAPADLPPDPTATGFQAHLHRLPPRRRQVLLLTAVEGFSLDEAAAILEITPEKAERELIGARVELSDQSATSVLIIEDEPIIAFDLTGIVSEMGHEVVGTAATRDEAVVLADRTRPGIVLADIQLRDGSSGIDAVFEIQRRHDVPVVFVTAYPEKLLTGACREPVYLVTKPFEPDVLKVTIYQALFAHDKTPPVPSSIC